MSKVKGDDGGKRQRSDAGLHNVSSCSHCSLGLACCACQQLFMPAVARHLTCSSCKHVPFSCCNTLHCCRCNKMWSPRDTASIARCPAKRLYGGAGSAPTSSPEPDIWTPSPRSSPDEIDDLTARANIPLPVSHSVSDASRAPSRASSIDVAIDVAATPLPTPDYASIAEELVDGFMHTSFPERSLLDRTDKRHFLGRGDLSVASLKLYARRIFTENTHWITVGHFLTDIFLGCTINGMRDDFRRFVILVGTQLGFGDLAQSMSESLDVNRKMADEYMRLRDIATTWKQKAKSNNSRDAKDGRKARSELEKAKGDIAMIHRFLDLYHHHLCLFCVSPLLPLILSRSSPLITQSQSLSCSLSLSSEHGPVHRSTSWPHQAKNLSSSSQFQPYQPPCSLS